MTKRIRNLGIEDRDLVMSLAKRAVEPCWEQGDFDRFLSHPSGYHLGTENPLAHGIQSFVLGLLASGDLDILSVATDPDARRQGHAEALFRWVLSDSKVKRIFLEVRASNQAAIGLYKKLGFTKTLTRLKYYGGVEDAWVMKHGY